MQPSRPFPRERASRSRPAAFSGQMVATIDSPPVANLRQKFLFLVVRHICNGPVGNVGNASDFEDRGQSSGFSRNSLKNGCDSGPLVSFLMRS
jgi:hypothetical protein